MNFIRSVLFNLYYFTSCAVISIGLTPLVIFGRKTSYFCCRVWNINLIFAAKYIAGIDYEIIGEIPNKPVIIASKHQSAWETAIFLKLLPKSVYVLKKELTYIPFFGWFMGFGGMIAVNRGGGASALKSLVKDSKTRLAEGYSVVIFPEGTRKEYGAAPDYKSGIAAIYNAADTEIVPVALDSGLYWPKKAFLKKAGRVKMEFLEPIKPGLKKKEFMTLLEDRIETAMNKKS